MSNASWSLTPLERAHLARRTAEMLALPEMACDKRRCRRTHICEFYDSKSGERWCLRHLDAQARAAWDELYTIAVKIADTTHNKQPSRDPRLRELEEAAIEIVRAVPLHDPLCHLFKNWLKAYRAGGSEQPVAKPDHLHPARQAPDIPVDDEVLDLRGGQYVVPEGADLDDFRNYR